MTKELTTKSPSGRPKRTPIGQRNRLSVKDKDPNYVYRIVNTVDSRGNDRVAEFQESGYEVVDAGTVGDKRVDNARGVGSTPEFSVGQGTKAVVMRIKREWYDEDQKAKADQIKAVEETMHRDAKRAADYGTFTTE